MSRFLHYACIIFLVFGTEAVINHIIKPRDNLDSGIWLIIWSSLGVLITAEGHGIKRYYRSLSYIACSIGFILTAYGLFNLFDLAVDIVTQDPDSAITRTDGLYLLGFALGLFTFKYIAYPLWTHAPSRLDSKKMCRYFAYLHDCPTVIDLSNRLHIPLTYPKFRNNPSFTGTRESIGLVTCENGAYQVSSAVWSYDRDGLDDEDRSIDDTSFNAHNPKKWKWRDAVKKRRALVFASEIGVINGKQGEEAVRYLMQSKEGFALGCLFMDWENFDGSSTRSFAVITSEPRDRFKKYHEKAFPLFLPNNSEVIKQWLDPKIQKSPVIDDILNNPRLPVDLEVTRVKTFEGAEALGETETLEKDW